MSPRRTPTRGLWWAAVLVSLVGVSSFIAARRSDATHRRVLQTNTVIYHLEALLSALKDAETGQRGFLITGRDEYLQPYYAAQRDVPREIEKLRRLTYDNPEQRRRLKELKPVVEHRFQVLTYVLHLRRTKGLPAAQVAMQSGTGKRLMDEMRREIGAMGATERSVLVQRSDAARQASVAAGLIAIGGAGLLFALGAYNTGVIQKDSRRQRELERSLRHSEERLSITLYSIGDAVMAVDALGSITLMNIGAQEISGWTEEEAMGRKHTEVFRIVNEDSRLTVESPIEQVLESREIVTLASHTVLLRRDGREVPIEDSAAPIFDVDGGLLGAILIFRDISTRKILEQAIKREAALARSMQLASLPKAVPAIPGLNIAARCEFADNVGGDFYLFLPNPHRIDLVVGDVAGKGTPAALAASGIAHLLPWLRPDGDRLASLRHLNHDLVDRLPVDSFATLVLAEVDANADSLRIWSAGHPPALLWSHAKHDVCATQVRNPLLGVFPEWNGEPEDWTFEEGDVLVLYSDGLSETRDLSGAMFEREIPKVLSLLAGSSADDIADALLHAANEWGKRADDLTLLVCKRVNRVD